MRHAVALLLLVFSVSANAIEYSSSYNDSRARRALSAEQPLSYDSQSGIIRFPSFTPTNTPTITLTPTRTSTPTPTNTIVWPLEQGGTNNGQLTNSGPNQVLRVIGGKVQNDVVPQANIEASFSLHVDPIFGTDSPECGPLNKPCKTLTGTQGAHARILAANDNGAFVCTTDPKQACTRCSAGPNAGQICNEDSDCPGGICSVLACLGTGTTCHKYCSVSDIICDLNSDCPSGETCNRQAPGQCLYCGGWPVSVCPSSGACNILHRKIYLVRIGAGELKEWIGHACSNDLTQQCDEDSDCSGGGTCIDTSEKSIPGPGYVNYIGADMHSTRIGASSSIATIYAKRRESVKFVNLSVANYASAGDVVKLDGGNFNILTENAALISIGNGWAFNVNGQYNRTIVLVRSWPYGFGSNASLKGVRFELWPGAICSNKQDRSCFSNSDCPSGGTCLGNTSSADFGIQESFIQPGAKVYSDDDAAVLFEARSCGSAFNLFLWNNLISANVQRSQYKGALIKTKQIDCDAGTPALLKDMTRIYMYDNYIAKTEFGDNMSPYYSIDIGAGTAIVDAGSNSYNACRRNIAGKLQYVDPAPNTFATGMKFGGGTGPFLGALECDTPQTPKLEQPTVSLSVSTTGGSLANGTYCYRATAYNSIGEGLPGAASCITASGCGSGTCRITITAMEVSGASGFKIYGRPSSSGGTFGLLQTLTGYDNRTWTDNGTTTPGAAPPTTDSSFIPNPVEGEIWITQLDNSKALKAFINNAIGVIPLAVNTTSTSAGALLLNDLSGAARARIADNLSASATDFMTLRGKLRLTGDNSTPVMIDCETSSGRCTVQSPTAAGHIATRGYVDSSTKTVSIGAGAFIPANTCTVDRDDGSGSAIPPARWIECPDASGSTIVTHIPMPDGWDGGSLSLRMITRHQENNSTISYDWSCACINNAATSLSYGSSSTLTNTSTTTSQTMLISSQASISCGGTCSGSSVVALRGVVNTTNSAWTSNAPKFLSAELRYVRSSHSD